MVHTFLPVQFEVLHQDQQELPSVLLPGGHQEVDDNSRYLRSLSTAECDAEITSRTATTGAVFRST